MKRTERLDAVSNILSAAYGIERRAPAPVKRKAGKKDDVDSFLAGIETSGSYGLKDVFSTETTGPLDPAAIKVKRNKVVKPRVKKDDSTGPLDPAGLMGNKVVEEKVKKVKKAKKSSGKRGAASPWVDHVKAFYAEKKREDPNYKYSQAMKDAKGTYQKM